MKTTDVYNPEAFAARVNYASHCLIHGIDSRRRDTCFEMNDGDAVVTALVRRASKNPRLFAAIGKGWRDLIDGIPAGWRETADKYADRNDLPVLAAELRARSAANWAARMAEARA